MRKYEFDYRVSVNGKVAQGKISATREKTAKQCPKIKHPGCKILECSPILVPGRGMLLGKYEL